MKCYVWIAARGESLEPRKGGGRPPKTGESQRSCSKGDLKERPAATVAQRRLFLEHAMGKALDAITVSGMLEVPSSTADTVAYFNRFDPRSSTDNLNCDPPSVGHATP